jgi:hypothetical protein
MDFHHEPAGHAHRRDSFPGFVTAPTIPLQPGEPPAQLGLKTTGLDLFLPEGQNLHFDLEGRLLRVATPNVQWRRGLSHQVLELRKRSRAEGGGFARRKLAEHEADQLVAEAQARTREVWRAVLAVSPRYRRQQPDDGTLEQQWRSALDRAARFSVGVAHEDAARFREVYGEIPILPPDQYTSLVLLSTEGCRYNRCTFCGFYRRVAYREKTAGEFRRHLDDVVRYHGRGLSLRRGIFLGQANALKGDGHWREEILRTINERLELPDPRASSIAPSWWQGSPTRFRGIATFLDAFTGARIGRREFTRLRQLNLRQVFIGMETGDARLLEWLRKPATGREIRQTVRAARASDLHVGVMVLLGAGGERFFDQHVRHSVELIAGMRLGRGDVVYLSPLVTAPDAEYARLAADAGMDPLSATRIGEQERRIRTGLDPLKTERGFSIARYDVANFFY